MFTTNKNMLSTASRDVHKQPPLELDELPVLGLIKEPISLAHLERWERIYENPFFIGDRVIPATEKDVINSLRYVPTRTKPTAMPSPYFIMKQCICKAKAQNEILRNEILKKILWPQSEDKTPFLMEKESISTFKPARFKPFPAAPKMKTTYKAMNTLNYPKTTRPLLRRPLAPVWNEVKPSSSGTSVHMMNYICKKPDLEHHSFYPDDFYDDNFALLLKKQRSELVYKPPSEIDMEFFYEIPERLRSGKYMDSCSSLTSSDSMTSESQIQTLSTEESVDSSHSSQSNENNLTPPKCGNAKKKASQFDENDRTPPKCGNSNKKASQFDENNVTPSKCGNANNKASHFDETHPKPSEYRDAGVIFWKV